MKSLKTYITEHSMKDDQWWFDVHDVDPAYFYAWNKRICLCRQDLIDGCGATEKEVIDADDFKMQKLVDTVAAELKKYAPFEKDGKKFTAARAFEMYHKGAFGDPDKAWLEEEVDTAWWTEVEKAAVKLGIIKQ